jgi:hypothetical protein
MKTLILLVLSLAAFAQTKDTAPRYLGSYTVATLPSAASWSGYVAVVTDASTAGSCTSGGGSALALCRSSGSAWATLGGSSGTTYTAGASGAITITGSTIDVDTAYVPGKASSNTWTGVNDFSGATSTIPQKMGTSFPATCTKGERYWHNTLDVEATCVATDVWSYTGGMPGKFSRIYDEMCGSDNYPDNSIMGERWFKIGSNADLGSSLSDANHTCTFNFYQTGANNAAGIALRYNSTNNDTKFGTLGGLNTTLGEFHFIFRVDATTQVLHRVGLASGLEQALPTNGIYAQYASNSGCTVTGSDTGWVYSTRSAGTSSTASGPTLTANTWVHLRIRSVTAGTWRFSVSVDGAAFSTEQSLSTNVPSGNMAPVFLTVPCEAAYKYMTVDLYHGFVATQR